MNIPVRTFQTLEAILANGDVFGRYYMDPKTGEPNFDPNVRSTPEPESQFLKRSYKLVCEFRDKVTTGYALSPEEARCISRWMYVLHPVLAMVMWTHLHITVANLFAVHPYLDMYMVSLGMNSQYIPALERFMRDRVSLKELGFED